MISVVVSHVRGGWTVARAFEELLDPRVLAISGVAALVPRFTMIVEDLVHLSDDDLAARARTPFQQLALRLLRDARDPARLLARFDTWGPLIAEAGRARSGPDDLRTLVGYLFQVVDPLYWDALRAKLHALDSSSQEIAMTIAEYLVEQGRAEGIAKGRLDALRSLLELKFRLLDAAAEARLQAATPEAVDRYLQRVLTADSLAVVLAD